MNLKENFLIHLSELQQHIKSACERTGRNPDEVKLMAVTKTHPPCAAEWAAEAGLPCIGENRVQEAADKRPNAVTGHVPWELIGPLQSNKAKLAISVFDRIQTVDRIKLVRALDKICVQTNIDSYPVLMQVNVGEDPAKHGCLIEEALPLAESIMESGRLRLEGLMTIGELSEDECVVRKTFIRLRELRDRLQSQLGCPLAELSMGMSGDLEWAIEEGSTLIRVGTALFGSRGIYPQPS